jgi:CPA2 family monovalent cation:H+ antiporter-2
MPHDVTLITTIAIAFVAAFILGYLANRCRLPPLVGYLLAGVAIGPFTPGYVADSALAGQLAEIGVILLMFGVGLHFSLGDLMAVRRLAVPGAVGQIVLATMVGVAVTQLWGWSIGGGLVFSISLSVASTVVLLKALEERNAVSSVDGRVAVGWLIVEDLAMVLVLVLLPAAAGLLGGHPVDAHGSETMDVAGAAQQSVFVSLVITLARVLTFGGIILVIGPKVLPWILRQVARTGSRELFTLAVLTLSIGIAFASAKLFGVSFALGAFFAGMVLNESDLSHKAAANSLPLQDAFAVLFFVSVGMLFDPAVIVLHPVMLLMTLLLILAGKFVIALGLVLAMGYPLSLALTVSAALSQVGEFSFILAGLGISHGLLPKEGLSLILGGAIFSISVNPLVFAVSDRLVRRVRTGGSKLENSDVRIEKLTQMEFELEKARLEAEKKAGSHEKFTPEELIERFPMFSRLTPEQREVVLLHFESQEAQPGERIIRAGDKADGMYFISAGQVEVSVANSRIKLDAGTFFGEMALLTGERRTADVTALDYCKFLKLRQSDFREILRRYPDIRQQVIALAGERKERNRQLFAQVADQEREEVTL